VAEKESFYSFEEALRELRLKEEELKRLVSEGEIRAFREGETMRLRRADVDNLRAELTGGEVVELGDLSEELVFEDDVPLVDEGGLATQELDVSGLDSGGMATQELEPQAAEDETLVEEDGVSGLEVLDEPAEREAAAATRAARRAAPAVEEEYEGGLLRIALIATSVVLFLGLPLALAIATGEHNAVAKALASIFE
jgi:excisionase family DNA binding protein